MAARESLIFLITQVFMLVGLFGLIIPVFPGTVVMWLATLFYGFATGWGTLGVVLFVIITVIMLASTVVDNIFMGLGARRASASWTTIAAAYVAGLAGTFFLPPIGGLIAAPLVILLLEHNRDQDWARAWQATKGLIFGWGLSFVVRFGLGAVMLLLWWLWVWKG